MLFAMWFSPYTYTPYMHFFQKLGTGLGGKIRTQVNIQMRKSNHRIASGFRDHILPVIWISDDLDKIDDDKVVERFKAML